MAPETYQKKDLPVSCLGAFHPAVTSPQFAEADLAGKGSNCVDCALAECIIPHHSSLADLLAAHFELGFDQGQDPAVWTQQGFQTWQNKAETDKGHVNNAEVRLFADLVEGH